MPAIYPPDMPMAWQIALEATARLLEVTPAVLDLAARVVESRQRGETKYSADYERIATRLLGVRIEPAYKSFTAVVPDEQVQGGEYRIGCNGTPERAMESAAWHILDQQGIPHVNSARSLKLKELRAMNAAELTERERALRHKEGNKAQAERRNIRRVQNERCKAADAMLESAKQAQAQLVKEPAI